MDIEGLLKHINDLVSGVISITPPKNNAGNYMPSTSLINVRINVTATPLDELFSKDADKVKLYPKHERNDPLIDVIETGNEIRVIATLPGIRTEDVWVNVKNGILTIEVMKYGQILKKEIPCNVSSEQISIKSSTVNNSVLEIVFDKV